jgi:hypothetical protein
MRFVEIILNLLDIRSQPLPKANTLTNHFPSPCRWFGRLRILVGAVLIFLLCGGPMASMQVVAWSSMLWSYSQTYGFEEAVSMTFSGEKPCSLCLAIQKTQREHEQTQSYLLAKTLELKLHRPPGETIIPLRNQYSWDLPIPPSSALTGISQTPDTPPPRFFS